MLPAIVVIHSHLNSIIYGYLNWWLFSDVVFSCGWQIKVIKKQIMLAKILAFFSPPPAMGFKPPGAIGVCYSICHHPWLLWDSNPRPVGYKSTALTSKPQLCSPITITKTLLLQPTRSFYTFFGYNNVLLIVILGRSRGVQVSAVDLWTTCPGFESHSSHG